MEVKQVNLLQIFYYVILVLSVTLDAGATANPAEENILELFAFSGHFPVPHPSFVYQVSLQQNDSHFCGGSIIDQRHVLTAAHCLVQNNDILDESSVTVVAGDFNLSPIANTRVTKNVTNIFVHEEYDAETFSNDIAILRIDPLGEFTEYVEAVPLATEAVIDHTECYITGWGLKYEDATSFYNKLQYATIPTQPLIQCNEAYNKTLPDGVICAGKWNGGVGPCKGDDGGPLVCNGKQLGIISFSLGCAKPGYPGVYTNVPYFTDWIKSQRARE